MAINISSFHKVHIFLAINNFQLYVIKEQSKVRSAWLRVATTASYATLSPSASAATIVMGVGAFHCCPSTTETITRAAAFVAFWWPFLGVNKAISKWACNATSTIHWWSCINCKNMKTLCVTQMDLTESKKQNWAVWYLRFMYLTFHWIWAIGNSGFLIS